MKRRAFLPVVLAAAAWVATVAVGVAADSGWVWAGFMFGGVWGAATWGTRR